MECNIENKVAAAASIKKHRQLDFKLPKKPYMQQCYFAWLWFFWLNPYD
jgi:hypothetical protein